MSDRYDVILYGATGFTGQQTARYFAARAPAGLRWAVAGRNRARLDEVARESGAVGRVVADSRDPAAVDAMVHQARVILTTAGPFSKYGTPVVDACVRHGVDYVDITGETWWVRELIDRYHDEAARRGTRIVPFCGFDSVPSDVGTLFLVDHLRRAGSGGVRLVSTSFTMRGGLNGGTLDTMLTMQEEGKEREVADPVLLNPAGRQSDEERARSRDLRSVVRDPERGVWLAPFVMASINTRVVRRSNALFAGYDRPYGRSFTYREAAEFRRRSKAVAMAASLGLVYGLVRKSWGRRMVRWLGPDPGDGPSEKTMDEGFFRCRLLGEGEDGRRALATLSFQGDPGNRATVAMLCESALLLCGPRDALPGGAERGGVLTPATALGLPLLERLRTAGLTAAVEDLPQAARP
ncbi:MAG: saccharopine dehydrogenase NADP-binding domain-containing protein [Gemmatimonadota bacterium]